MKRWLVIGDVQVIDYKNQFRSEIVEAESKQDASKQFEIIYSGMCHVYHTIPDDYFPAILSQIKQDAVYI